MKASVFQNELAKTSSVFGRKKDVTVVFEGSGAATNGSVIKLPAFNMNATVTEEQAAILRGYVDHEAGHVRHTDFSSLTEIGDELRTNKLLKQCANALEDVWLEQRVMSEYPGAELNLRATADAVNREFLDNVSPTDPRINDPVWVGPVAATWIGRQGYVPVTAKQCADMLDPDLRNEITEIVSRVSGCKNSHDVMALAREFEGKMRGRKAAMPEETPEGRGSEGEPEWREGFEEADGDEGTPQPTGSDEAEKPEESESDDAKDGDADGDVGDGPRGEDASDEDGASGPEGTPDRRGDGDGKPDDGATSATDGDGVEDDVYEDFDVKKAVQRALEGSPVIEAGSASRVYKPYSTAHDKWHHRKDAQNKYGRKHSNNEGFHILGKGQAQTYDRVLDAMSGTVNGMRRKLERALIAKQMRDWDVGREAGRLDTKRLTAAMAGRVNVFKTRTDRHEMDTAVTVLVDLSGSMNRGYPAKIEIARQTAIAFVEAVDRTGIKYEVLGFQNKTRPQSDDDWNEALRNRENDYSRFEPLDMYVFKQFDERLHEAKGSIGSIVEVAYGNNTDGEAVELAYRRLLDRPESRKILIVLSDGHPVAHGNRGQQQQHLRNVVSEIEADKRCDIVGIGIKSDDVNRFYAKHVVVHDTSDLAGTVMDQLARLLMGERFVVDNSQLVAAHAR